MLKPRDILDFWFGPLDEAGLPAPEKEKLWFRVDKAFDQLVRRRFLSYVLMASEEALNDWVETPDGRLALILLLDQFPRNIFRGTAMAFEYDVQARRLCREGLRRGDDVNLPIIHRAFFYMPMQHSERREDQAESVALFEQLHAASRDQLKDKIGVFLHYARDHRDVVQRFGRFPHRNAVLKRASTEAEEAFLRQAERYGQ